VIAIHSSWRKVNHIQAMLCLLLSFLPTSGIAQANPPNVEDLVNSATAAREQNDLPRAIELYRQIVKLDPQWPDGWWFLGSLEYATNSYREARDAFTHYIDLTPNAVPALAIRGLCEFETGDYSQSLKDIERGLAFGAANQPRNEIILRYHYALLLTKVGRFEDALKAFGLFVRDPDPKPELLVAIGLAGLRQPLLPREVRSDQQELYAAAGKAAFDFMKGVPDTAREEFQQLFERKPAVPNVHYLYGYLLYASDPDLAVIEFQRELEVNPSNPAAEVMLSWILLMQDRPAEALPHAEKAVAGNAGSAGAQLVLGRAFTGTDDTRDGIDHLEKAAQLDPGNLEVHIALAKAYSKSGRKDDARRERLLCLEITKNETPLATHP